jgi:hypothetical protein
MCIRLTNCFIKYPIKQITVHFLFFAKLSFPNAFFWGCFWSFLLFLSYEVILTIVTGGREFNRFAYFFSMEFNIFKTFFLFSHYNIYYEVFLSIHEAANPAIHVNWMP